MTEDSKSHGLAFLRTHKRQVSLLLAVALVAVLGVSWWLINQNVADKSASKERSEVITHTTTTPSESKSAAQQYEWRGAVGDPKKIIIPTAGVDAFIQNMGVDQNKEVAAPNNIHLAGWFVNSMRPGQRGLSIIDGHVHGRTDKNAVFAKLSQLKAGDTFTVIKGDDTELTYKVMDVRTLEVNKVSEVLYSQDPTVQSQLNLITCSGAYDRQTQEYQSRTVVAAALQ